VGRLKPSPDLPVYGARKVVGVERKEKMNYQYMAPFNE
jgi:hypothetical protein